MIQKMSEEKGNAMLWAVVLLGLLLHNSKAHAATIIVGDSAGWTFNIEGWENGKSFKAGDILVFKYDTDLHSVVVADKPSYDFCRLPQNAPKFTSGNDQIVLKKGANYFICGTMGHCDAGMRIAINAA